MGRNAERIEIRKALNEHVDFEGSFDSIRESLSYLEDKYSEWDLYIEREYSYSEYESDSWELYGKRLENDEEYALRMAKNAKARKEAREKRAKDKLRKEAEEKALYEKLKDKYGEV